MLLLIDSASAIDVRAAYDEGLASGVTMNPTLVAAEGSRRPLDSLAAVLAAAPSGPVFYQPTAVTVDAAQGEIDGALGVAGDRLVVKLPAAAPYLPLAVALRGQGVPVALTAVYSPAQALVAANAGCAWVIPYVDRARRLLPPSEQPLVPALAAVLAGMRTSADGAPRILAASVKSAAQAVGAVSDGAHAVTAPLGVLRELVQHPLSDAALEEFRAPWR